MQTTEGSFMGRCIKRVAFEDVLACFDEEHEVKPDNTNEHARNMLQAAQEKFNGNWACVSLDREEVLNIYLPHHISEGGAIPLIPPTGLTVVAAVEAIKEISTADYQSANPVCWRKIAHWKENNASPTSSRTAWKLSCLSTHPSEGTIPFSRTVT